MGREILTAECRSGGFHARGMPAASVDDGNGRGDFRRIQRSMIVLHDPGKEHIRLTDL